MTKTNKVVLNRPLLMKRVCIIAEGKDLNDLAMAVEHALNQLQMKTPSENITWEDKSHVDYTVQDIEEAECYAESCS